VALPKSLTTATTFSKTIALFLFIHLPFAGFYLGYKYREGTSLSTPIIQTNLSSNPTPTLTINTVNWETYTNNKLGFSIKYPQDFTIKENEFSTQFYSKDFIYPKGEYGEIVRGGVITVTVFQTSNNLNSRVERFKKK